MSIAEATVHFRFLPRSVLPPRALYCPWWRPPFYPQLQSCAEDAAVPSGGCLHYISHEPFLNIARALARLLRTRVRRRSSTFFSMQAARLGGMAASGRTKRDKQSRAFGCGKAVEVGKRGLTGAGASAFGLPFLRGGTVTINRSPS